MAMREAKKRMNIIEVIADDEKGLRILYRGV